MEKHMPFKQNHVKNGNFLNCTTMEKSIMADTVNLTPKTKFQNFRQTEQIETTDRTNRHNRPNKSTQQTEQIETTDPMMLNMFITL